MSSHYYHRSSGFALMIKLGVLIVALYLTYLLLKIFAIVLSAVFAVLKILLPIAVIVVVAYFLLKHLFGIDLLPHSLRRLPYYRK